MSEIALEQDLQGTDLQGTVVAVQANFYEVQLAEKEKGRLLCTRRDLLRKIGQKVVVGDRVIVVEPDWQGKRGAIAQVLERSSELDRPPVANVDQILLVFAISEPKLDPNQLSRFLVKAESTGLNVMLCLSKCDLVSEAEQQEWHDRLSAWGYPPTFISTLKQLGLDRLATQLIDRTTVVSGPSGVGKSSLINHLIPHIELRISEVSGKLKRGRHTTRHVELFELPQGGLLADTPGFNQPDLDYLPEALALYFPEIVKLRSRQTCQFNNCRHANEPGCVVRGDWERYPLYLQYLQDAIAYERKQNKQSDSDATMKQKTKGNNQVTYEPRLNPNKYRQESRRSSKQNVQHLKGNAADFLQDEDGESDCHI
jgi:ribosome biogenesis GTPase / thiamine phosphate phosphatase